MPKTSNIRREEVDKLIDLVRENEPLYNPNSLQYKDREWLQNTWQSIADAMGRPDMDAETWKKEWRNRRDTYVKKRKIIRTTRSGLEANRALKWVYLDAMSFIDPYLETGRGNKVPAIREEDPEQEQSDSNDSMDGSASSIERSNQEQRDHLLDFIPGVTGSMWSTSFSHTRSQMSEDRGTKRTMSSSSSRQTADLQRQSPSSEPCQKCQRCCRSERFDSERTLIELINDCRHSRQDTLLTPSKSAEQSFFEHCAKRMERLPEQIKSCLQVQISQLFYNAENPYAPPMTLVPLPVDRSKSAQHRSQHQTQITVMSADEAVVSDPSNNTESSINSAAHVADIF